MAVADDKTKPRVLLVDDDDDVLALVPMILREEGFEVDVASGASEAAFAVGETSPDAVVLDYMMPDEDGASVAQTLRRLVPGVRILGFSAATSTADGWADAFVPKNQMTSLGPELRKLLEIS